ncbi:hypothetical protein M409DRAFT_28619 [Zasmidium cellare ATCC 36951]|uniref:Uncharacterized protein n=1 Tax=Zasmidium cellare ATCC 36951 TaxID=1080233 RepID=A0A6A6C567_ZASCE|nr:uncharacterized protein M409DRAFT_28619 [Zasmidium cellare ATCC 36951]KAF2161012.1 hypothetical protein M409DRAFT_28619 [Zasmidium cellare ATCC 36951]
MASTMLGTSDVPENYWKAARLTGKIPFSACQADPRISYCMYIPQAHYQVHPAGKNMPLVVNIRGSLRRAETCRDSLIDLADSKGVAILAPLFPGVIDGPNDSHGYKFLSAGSAPSRTRYDLILLSILDEVAVRWPGIEVSKVFLAGYSGGGQFALRFFYLHPEKLAGVSIGAPGTVTRLDGRIAWPWGLDGVEKYFAGGTVDFKTLAAVPHVQLLVGDDDVAEVNEGLWRVMPASTMGVEIPLPPGNLSNRLDAVSALHGEFEAIGIRSELVVVPGVAHSSDKIAPDLIRWLERVVPEQVAT